MLATLSTFVAGFVVALVAAGYAVKRFEKQADDLIAFLRKS